MASKTNSSGRIVMVNPNPDGLNIRPPEDLSIVVDLETTKKGRSIITVDSSNSGSITSEGDNDVVRFITGSEFGEKKSLTTSYTNITTTFNKEGEDFEGLGITDIDISFNSSYAPLIKINFIDVRGSSILEQGNDSKYNVFFNLPYPIFKLTIKGFYGQAVTYCLHLTKFNSKFNSQTGNFEIQCEFVGYTYAFLTDMLMGYLKAIGETTRGRELLQQKGVISIQDLLTEIGKLNLFLQKLKQDDDIIKSLIKAQVDIEKFERIDEAIDTFISLIVNNASIEGRLNNLVFSNDNLYAIKSPITDRPKQSLVNDIKNYEDSIKSLIEVINEDLDERFKLNTDSFKNVGIFDTKNRSLKVSDISDPNQDVADLFKTKSVKNSRAQYNSLVSKLDEQVKAGNITEDTEIVVINMDNSNNELNTKETTLNSEIDSLNVAVSDKVTEEIGENFKFDTSIRGILSILAAHVDVLMQVIREVANEAENNSDRNQQLTKLVSDLDVSTDDDIYPFPMYVEDKVETWIGNKVVSIPETDFIEELLRGFLKVGESDKILQNKLLSGLLGWYPVSMLDTLMFSYTNPYNDISNVINYKDALKLVGSRAFLFLDYTNRFLKENEIKAMAKAEARNLISNLQNDLIKTSIKTIDGDTPEEQATEIINILKTPDNVFQKLGTSNVIINEKDNSYEYVYLDDDSIPIDGNLKKDLKAGSTIKANLDSKPQIGTYLKVFTVDEYLSFERPIDYELDYEPVQSVIVLSTLKDSELTSGGQSGLSAEFQMFSGKYGFQEFFVVKEGIDKSEIPTWTYFYSDTFSDSGWNGSAPSTTGFTTNNIYRANFSTPRRVLVNSSDLDIIGYLDNGFRGGVGTSPFEEFLGDPFDFANERQPVNKSYSLFGSELYFEQGMNFTKFTDSKKGKETTKRARAFLFLHTLPFNGLAGTNTVYGVFKEKKEYIASLFSKRAGFIETPKSWVLFIGGILWRKEFYDSEGFDPIWFQADGRNFVEGIDVIPSVTQYCKVEKSWSPVKVSDTEAGVSYMQGMTFSSDNESYRDIEEEFFNLPDQVKNELIEQFTNWVDGNGHQGITWDDLRSNLEIEDYSQINDKNSFLNFRQIRIDQYNKVLADPTSISGETYYINTNNYKIIDPNLLGSYFTKSTGDTYSYLLYRISATTDKNNITRKLINFLTETRIIANTTWRIWGESSEFNRNFTDKFEVSKSQFKNYLTYFMTEVDDLVSDTLNIEKTQELKNELFNTIDNDKIKLNLYRTIKAIYDKWIAGTGANAGTIVTCSGVGDDDLISSFRFIDKAFRDIGDKFKINPLSIRDALTTNYNQSFYDFVTRILVDNNFDFVPLPTYINYRDEDQIKQMFETIPYVDYPKSGVTGPSFVCVYVGQPSKHLDLGKNSQFENDGIIFDFNNPNKVSEGFNDGAGETIPVFFVNYAKGNQSIFKDIKLDQSEYSETDESLKIIDDISLRGEQSNRTYVGQNLFNVFSTRSYSTEVEAMGNAMIQPMMYFQLNNIPMFRGGYLITSVRHKIKPNYMTTNFKGVRVNKIFTPLIDESTMYMNLIGSLSDVDVNGVEIIETRKANDEFVEAGDVSNEDRAELLFEDPIDVSTAPNNQFVITSLFGIRKGKKHKGIDIRGTHGVTKIQPTYDGEIYRMKIQPNGYGLYLILKHELNDKVYWSIYAHLEDYSQIVLNKLSELLGYTDNFTSITELSESDKNKLVTGFDNVGLKIKNTDSIGFLGGDPAQGPILHGVNLAGSSEAKHLHFEIRENNSGSLDWFNNSTPKDPAQLIESSRSNDGIKYAKDLDKSDETLPDTDSTTKIS
jgi:hypothetical protein